MAWLGCKYQAFTVQEGCAWWPREYVHRRAECHRHGDEDIRADCLKHSFTHSDEQQHQQKADGCLGFRTEEEGRKGGENVMRENLSVLGE